MLFIYSLTGVSLSWESNVYTVGEESGVIALMVIKEGETALPISVNVTVLSTTALGKFKTKTYSKDRVLYLDCYHYSRKH